ncbi:MAG: metal ABC transporter ATP-binding protein [Acidimicrobiales bacterium]
MTSLVRVDGVTCHYGGEPVLVDASLDVRPGAFTGIVGPSGSGKTTLLRCILGTVKPARGTVWRAADVQIAYVPQVETVNWNFPVTVAETVLMARTRGRRLPWPSAGERCDAEAVLDRLGLGGLGRRHIRELSGGQQQRVFLARALVSEPQLILLDEPTAGVDVRTRHEVLHVLADLNSAGLAIVLTTHDLNGMAAHLPHLVCLNRVVTGKGSPREVLTPAVLERTYGAPMEVLEHGGMPVVVDRHSAHVVAR